MKNQLFPKYLNRLQYLTRLVLFFVIVVVATILLLTLIPKAGSGKEVNPPIIVFLVLCALTIVIIRVLALDLPRIRSAGWNSFLLLLYLVPGAGAILQLCLFLAAPKFIDPSTDSYIIFPATSSGGRLANRILMGFVWFVVFVMLFTFIAAFFTAIIGQSSKEMPDGYMLPITISALVVSVVCTILGLLPGTKKITAATI